MTVPLPTSADLRKIRQRAARAAVERAAIARTPLLALLGAGDLWVSTVTKAVTGARAGGDAGRLTAGWPPGAEELRRAADGLRGQAKDVYAGFAERGETAWGRFRATPQVKRAAGALEAYGDKLEARVDALVDDTHDAAERVLTTVGRQTRATGEKLAQATQGVTGRAAEGVSAAGRRAAATGAKAGEAIDEAGTQAAAGTRRAARTVAHRAEPPAATGRSTVRSTAAADATT